MRDSPLAYLKNLKKVEEPSLQEIFERVHEQMSIGKIWMT